MINQKNAVAYIRVSTNMQVDGFSLDGQLKEIKDYCKRNNLNFLRAYRDEGISGTSTENRTYFNNMLNDISKDKNIDTVVVWKLSRLSRNMNDLTSVIKFFEDYNVSLKSVNDNIDTEKGGKLLLYLTGTVAEMERDGIIENCKMGMRERAMQGKWNGGKVYSYRSKYNDEIKENKLEIEENEAIIVREIFNLFVNENCGYKKIAVALNNRGLKTMRNSSWSIQSIKQIIDNPVYKGYIKWGQYVDWSKNRREGKQEEYILVKGIHEPIVSEEIWEKARKIRESTGKISEKEYEGNYLLSGLIKCPVCGASMISHKTPKSGKPGEFYRYYQCSNFFNKGSSVCKSNLVKADKAEEEVLRKINEIVRSKEIIEAIINRMERQSYVDITPLENQLKEIKKKLKKLDDKKSEYLEQEFEGEIDITTLDERLKHLASKKSKASDEFNSIQNEINNVNSQIKIEPEKVRAILENFELIFEKADIVKKKKLLKSVIESISVIQGESARDRKVGKVKLYFMAEDVEFIGSKKFESANGAVNHIINKCELY